MDIPALIIYVSGYEKYLKELFNTEPFRFLSKPIDIKSFDIVFQAAYKRISQKFQYFTFSYNKSFIKIPLNSIYYFESNNRVIHIHMPKTLTSEKSETNQPTKFYGKMNDLEKKLSESSNRFIRIHQSYLVNFDYIRSMNFTSITMHDGKILQISEERQKNVRIQFCAMAGMEI